MPGKREGQAAKGSQYWLQWNVNKQKEDFSTIVLSSCTGLMASGLSEIEWISPLEGDNYREYRDDFLDALDLSNRKELLHGFWPDNGPQWDGLARLHGRDMTGVLLVEAKSYPKESETTMGAQSPASITLIERSLARVQGYMGITSVDWTKPYYQLANRISFLYFLNVIVGIPTWLALISFVNDRTHVPTSLKAWVEHYSDVFRTMKVTGNSRLLPRIFPVFVETPSSKR